MSINDQKYASIDEMVLAIQESHPTYYDKMVGKNANAITVWVSGERAIATQRDESGWWIFGCVGNVTKKEKADAIFGFYGAPNCKWLPVDYKKN